MTHTHARDTRCVSKHLVPLAVSCMYPHMEHVTSPLPTCILWELCHGSLQILLYSSDSSTWSAEGKPGPSYKKLSVHLKAIKMAKILDYSTYAVKSGSTSILVLQVALFPGSPNPVPVPHQSPYQLPSMQGGHGSGDQQEPIMRRCVQYSIIAWTSDGLTTHSNQVIWS